MVIYLMRGSEGNVAEGMEELRSAGTHCLREGEGERKCVEKQWPAASAPPLRLDENVTQ